MFPGEKWKYLLAFLNTKIANEILTIINPTLNYGAGSLANLPIVFSFQKKPCVENIVDDCVMISRIDWDSFETSWDFKRHPLLCTDNKMYLSWENDGKVYSQEEISNVPFKHYLKLAYESWELECENRFRQLKSNEEELNCIFIDIYGLQDELTPEVEDKDITVRKADLQRDIRSLLSYAVGCMFGRYSLDVEGLAYAGGDWDSSKYTSFIPDDDNIIPITDEEYFSDDIVGRFCEWLKVVYGEDTLEENLDFIAQALGNKGDTSREVIRNYFLIDFIKDHIKIYQKRPIYWLFDSGKANGFKALIYMHRYHQDTVGTVRTEYLHKLQKAIEKAMERAEYIRDNGSGSEKAKATKQITKYTKQLAEIHTYDEAMAHIANQRIVIDLDDGVKVNYAKFQGVEVAQEGKKVLKVNLLSKI